MAKSYNQRNAKVDSNQPQIVKGLRRIGAKVLPCHQLKNAFDILVGYKGKLFMMEIKNPEYLPKKYLKESAEDQRKRLEGLLSEGEHTCMEVFQSVGVNYHIISTLDEALIILNKE